MAELSSTPSFDRAAFGVEMMHRGNALNALWVAGNKSGYCKLAQETILFLEEKKSPAPSDMHAEIESVMAGLRASLHPSNGLLEANGRDGRRRPT